MLVTPNFDEVSSPIQAGAYDVRITAGELKEFKTGTKYLNWTLETINDEDVKDQGRKIFHKTIIHGKGAFQLRNFYSAATGEMIDGEFDTEQLLGKELKVVIVDGTDQEGNPSGYTEVKAVGKI